MTRVLRIVLFAVMIASGVIAGGSNGTTMEVALTVLVLALIGESALMERERLARQRHEMDEVLAELRAMADKDDERDTR